MKQHRAARVAAILALVVVAALAGASTGRAIPRCEEDAVLIGTGDFHAGQWTAYQCGPAVDDR
jgi:hypothetical protein